MNPRRLFWKLLWSMVALVLIGGTLACSEVPAGPRAWIDVPLDGSSVPAGTPVTVISHVYAREGVAEVLLSVNGEAYRRSPPAQSDASLSKASQDWIPQQAGDYVLQVRAYSKNGQASNPATVRVRALGEATPTPTGAAPLVRTATPDRVTPLPVGAADLAIVSVEAIVVGYKGDAAICKPRVVYRNAGTVPVPSDYIIQLHVNGVPQMTMTRGAGFGVGGTSEAIFDYRFEGMPYIGINLDSTNAVIESNETNNAFAEIRACGATPVPTTPTFTPTRTPTTPATYTPTRTPTTPATYTPTRTPTTPATPPATHTPTRTPTRTRTPTPDTQGPPAPHQVSPSGTLSCRSSVTLDWNAVSDPSGIQTYYVKLERQITPGNWQSAGGWTTSSTAQSASVQCGGIYRWQVRAEDNAGNDGPWAGPMNFSIDLP